VNFDQLYENLFKSEVFEKGKAPDLRASGAPFCPKKFIYDYIDFLDGNSTWNYFGSFYCDIGTSIHSAIQYWIPKANEGHLYGNWKCHHCHIEYSNKVGPLKCGKCNSPMEYKEIVIKFRDAPLIGHTDGLLLDTSYITQEYGNLTIGQFNDLVSMPIKKRIPAWILELKSTGLYKAKTIKHPQPEHKRQASLYALAIQKMPEYEKLFDIKGIIIKYISRDNPRVRSQDLVIEVTNEEIYDDTCLLINIIIKMLNSLKVKRVHGITFCESYPYFEYCDYRNMCDSLPMSEFKIMVNRVAEHWFTKPKNFISRYNLFS